MRHRGYALRRRYGRAAVGGDGTFTIEKSEFGPFFVVKLARDLEVGSSGKSITAGTTLGTINERGTIRISRSAGYVPRGYTESAKSLLEAARHDLKESGQIMKRQRARELAEEQASGTSRGRSRRANAQDGPVEHEEARTIGASARCAPKGMMRVSALGL